MVWVWDSVQETESRGGYRCGAGAEGGMMGSQSEKQQIDAVGSHACRGVRQTAISPLTSRLQSQGGGKAAGTVEDRGKF